MSSSVLEDAGDGLRVQLSAKAVLDGRSFGGESQAPHAPVQNQITSRHYPIALRHEALQKLVSVTECPAKDL